ncbi:MAG: NifB/NifX family molybdenum-iron cluster-binding protein [Candidatus Aenigmarchaeota archaeon]|nr:NifB/NifX family molybdenum-iron cluster-binding protein [Candidatus Aenigmarchaeota archaeon]
MKIAVASNGKDENSQISPVGGRAPYYLIFEGKTLTKVISNPFRIGGGAGWGVARMLADEEVNVVVVGRLGENMKAALAENGIKCIEMSGTVKDAVESISGKNA